jgi:predicted nucleic-acid-binding Zn-ribbon protein
LNLATIKPRTFKLKCPKCASTSISIERLGSVYAREGSWANRVLKCITCGNRLYGDDIKDEVTRQMDDFDASKKRATAQAARTRREERIRAAAEEEEARQVAEAAKEAAEEARRAAGRCALPTCQNDRRERSIYCSRSCSNRNARIRFKQRKAEGK